MSSGRTDEACVRNVSRAAPSPPAAREAMHESRPGGGREDPGGSPGTCMTGGMADLCGQRPTPAQWSNFDALQPVNEESLVVSTIHGRSRMLVDEPEVSAGERGWSQQIAGDTEVTH